MVKCVYKIKGSGFVGEVIIEQEKKLKGMDATTIKFIAIAAMLIDHVAWAFVPTYSALGQGMHIIGRITASIMCFFIVEGYHHTKNIENYILRMAIFAIVSHLPFVFFETGYISLFGNTGVIYTLLLGLLALVAYNNIKSKPLKILAILALCLLAMFGDWMCITILMVLNFEKFRGDFKKQAIGHIIISILVVVGLPLLSGQAQYIYSQLFQLGMILALPILYFYNGQKGEFAVKHKKFSKWVFYIFYPAHLLILGLLKLYI